MKWLFRFVSIEGIIGVDGTVVVMIKKVVVVCKWILKTNCNLVNKRKKTKKTKLFFSGWYLSVRTSRLFNSCLPAFVSFRRVSGFFCFVYYASHASFNVDPPLLAAAWAPIIQKRLCFIFHLYLVHFAMFVQHSVMMRSIHTLHI